ncbi:MATE family efflux transporter [Spiroplasma endosymbiont of Polydrusus formosus]|uniref:MATE family efflux transporter n=1 Tax=Spiroplasma endosymbiont of Polydrusus formosus TaxID=3139326 RepID=UPI0035B551BA
MSKILTIREKKLRFEKPWKTIAYFCIPTVFIMVIQGLYNIVDKSLALSFATPDLIHDQFYIDAYNRLKNINVTEIPLADMRSFINVATQYASQTYNLQWSFSIMIGMGCAMNFSIAYGQRNIPAMRRIAGNGLSVTFLFSMLVSFVVFCIVFPGWNAVFITSQMGKHYNPITESLCWEYSFPMLAAPPMMFLSYYFISLIRSEGQIKWVIIMVLSSLLINAATAIFFMQVCNLGMSGAMLGTVFSWTVQVIWGFIIVFKTKNSYSKFYWSDLFHIEGKNIANFVKAGLPNFINNAALVVTSYVATSLIVQLPNQGEHNGVAVLQEIYSSIVPWMTLILSAGVGVTQGARSIIAYNYGAKNSARIWEILKRVSLLIIIWFSLMLVVFVIFGKYMMMLFALSEETAIKYRWLIVLNFMTYPFCSLTYIALTLFQGINRSFLATFTSSLRSTLVILPLIGIGYGVSRITGNPIFYYVFIGLNDLISALIIIPILVYYWKKYHIKLVDETDPYFNEYQDDLRNKKVVKINHKNKN